MQNENEGDDGENIYKFSKNPVDLVFREFTYWVMKNSLNMINFNIGSRILRGWIIWVQKSIIQKPRSWGPQRI